MGEVGIWKFRFAESRLTVAAGICATSLVLNSNLNSNRAKPRRMPKIMHPKR